MYVLQVITVIAAPAARCFDLARSVDAHVFSADASGERAVGGRTSRLLGLNEEVTWEGRHFGVRQQLTSRITQFDRPNFFQDRMVKGAFRHLEHDHRFDVDAQNHTTMVDGVRFAAPGGPIGWLGERLLLGPYLGKFLRERGLILKRIAESDEWKRFLPADESVKSVAQ